MAAQGSLALHPAPPPSTPFPPSQSPKVTPADIKIDLERLDTALEGSEYLGPLPVSEVDVPETTVLSSDIPSSNPSSVQGGSSSVQKTPLMV